MAEELQGSLSSFNFCCSLRCNDIFSSSGDIEETFECFPATADLFELSKANSFDYFTQPSSFDLFSSSADWHHSYHESSEDRATAGQCKAHMDFTETSGDSKRKDLISHGFVQLDQTLSELAMDEIQILPTVGFPSNSSLFSSTTASRIESLDTLANTKSSWKSNKTASRDSLLPIAKKIRIETPSPLPTFKVRKEKLGDRITALQQLVSPFGKTDTASVLHEAIEYIKYLHEQVNGLSNPYLINGHQSANQQILETQAKNGNWAKKDLRSLGLCLVPISTTFTMGSNELPPNLWTQLWNMENHYTIRGEE